MQESYAGQGGVLFVSQPFISVFLNKVKISKPTAISGGVAFVENAFRFDVIDSELSDFKANKSSLMYSSSEAYTLAITRSLITCEKPYKTDDRTATLQNNIIPPFNSTNTIYLTGTALTQVIITESTFKQCGINEDGGVFRLEGKVNFTDSKSTYSDNSAIEGAIISCSGCNVTMVKSTISNNQAIRGGVIKLEALANFTAYQVYFVQNSARELGGVIFATTQSLFNIKNSEFLKNFADVSSTIDALGVSSTGTNYIELCNFEQNRANKNTISLNKARASISKSSFIENTANERSKNLFIGFSEVNISDCTFRSTPYNNPIKIA
jgi:predicted outer membrane repeat protein